jgi:subtilisin family serine protease
MNKSKLLQIMALVMILTMAFAAVALADVNPPTLVDGPGDAPGPATSPYLIVELESPPLVAIQANTRSKLDMNAPDAQAYISQLQAEQAAFMAELQNVLTDASVATFINETGAEEQATYQILFNGLSINPGSMDKETARELISRMDGVKWVAYDTAHETQLYTSTYLINAPAVWNSPAIGGVENAGAGVKVASMDGGLHKDAPMFDGTGYEYPDGFKPNGIGLTQNNNGKIIASRTYFRSWDPPASGDENPWPGVNGTSHGTHTGSTAAGNCVDNVTYAGYNVGTMCGVAPKAYVMSYRVFYASVSGDGSFYTTEGLAALEDIAKDGADVLNNSWGAGPWSEGGQYDPLDTALINATKAGIFVSMSAGNSGPGPNTVDHPSDDYISVAASTTSGTLSSGRVSVVEPEPVPDELTNFAFATADFGDPLPIGVVDSYSYKTAAAVDPANTTGCEAFPEGAFDGVAAVISRGGCFFADKIYYAEQAGATFAIIYNNAGDGLINMACGGDFCDPGEINISSIFIGQGDGEGMVGWYAANGDASQFEFNSIAYQAGNIPDRIIDFSSRGPAVSNVLKPDIAAPGVNILAQGYTPGATGEARHLGYGQASGTSMASPHVAGSAALLRQLHPGWSNAYIKSALMSTSKYMDIYTMDGSPAQPLDMGAGRLDVGAAMDPGVILDPPSLSFGNVVSGTQKSITVNVTSVADAAETYTLDTVYTGDSFTQTTTLPGFSINPASISLAPGETKSVEVTFDSTQSMGYGDNQGYITMAGDQGHNAHMPAWARVSYATKAADVLILDNDFSFIGPFIGVKYYDYTWYYAQALEDLGLTYDIYDVDAHFGSATTIPDAATLARYDALIWETGDNYSPDGTFTIPTGPTQIDQDKLTEYMNNGGTVIAMGQDLASVFDTAKTDDLSWFYGTTLGSNWFQDSISAFDVPTETVKASDVAPVAFSDVKIDLSQPHNYVASGELSGDNEVPPVATGTTGDFDFEYNIDQNVLQYQVTVVPTTTTPITVTGAHIHQGAVGENGPAVISLDQDGILPVFVTDTLTFQGVVGNLPPEVVEAILTGNFYVNIHTEANPSGEVRGQIEPQGLIQQIYVDEIGAFKIKSPNPIDQANDAPPATTVLVYPGTNNLMDGGVTVINREQPALENPGVVNNGRSAYASFGLQDMAESDDMTTRSEFLGLLLNWANSEAETATIADTTDPGVTGVTVFTATYGATRAADAQAVSYRWDFGDGSDYVPTTGNEAEHTYTCGDNNVYTVRVEITDDMGNVAIGSGSFDVSDTCEEPTAIDDEDPTFIPNEGSRIFLPVISNK